MRRSVGFTLIELMVVVAIIAILASVAVPSYQTFVQDGRRAEGQAFALDIASRQERHFTQFSAYATSLTATDATGLGMASANSENGYYSGETSGGTLFTIILTSTVTDAGCETLTLDNTGERGSTGTETTADCWR